MNLHPLSWNIRHRTRDGLILFDSGWQRNVLPYEGEQLVLGSFFRNDPLATPASFQIGLCNMAPVATTTAATLSGEPSGGGYGRIAVGRDLIDWPSLSPVAGIVGNPYVITSMTYTMTAVTNNIGPFSSVFMVAMVGTTPYLISAASSGGMTSIPVGDSADITVAITLTT